MGDWEREKKRERERDIVIVSEGKCREREKEEVKMLAIRQIQYKPVMSKLIHFIDF